MKADAFRYASLIGVALGLVMAADVKAEGLYLPYYYDTSVPHQEAYPMAATSGMYNYSYDPNLDVKKPPYVAPTVHDDVANPANVIKLGTQSGLMLGVQFSEYKYKEPDFASLSGPKFGLTMNATGQLGNGFFLGVDGRFAFGYADYSGSGTSSGHFEDLMDIRPIFGKDFVFPRFGISPYFGLGYRHLYSDDRGTTTTGASGYERFNNLIYIPLGITPRFRVTDDSRIASTIEFDPVLTGLEMTKLQDVDSGDPGIHNKQSGGYGFRMNAMWEHQDWAIGPFLIYWNIQQSNTTCASGSVYVVCGLEPANSTTEGGVQFIYHFF